MAASEPTKPGLSAYLMVASLVLIWGSNFLLVKLALREASPSLVAAARIVFAMLALVPVAVLLGKRPPKGVSRWIGCLCIGALTLALPFSLLAWAQQTLPSGVAGVYMAVIPLLILPMAHVFSPGERMTRRKLIGFVVGFCGVLLLIGPETLRSLGGADGRAQLACLGAAFSYACGSIVIRRTPSMDPVAMSAVALVTGSVLIAPFGIAAWPEQPLSSGTLALLILIGVVSTGLAMLLRVSVITTAGSVFMSGAGYLVPVTALGIGAVFGGEVFERSDLAATALILCGLGVAQGFIGPRAGR